jgi:hypothetical protein
MKELNESTARLGLTDDEMKVGQISLPVLRGSWKKKIRKDDDEGGFVTTKKEFNLNGSKVLKGRLLFKQPVQYTSLMKIMMLLIACNMISIVNQR